MKLLPLLAIYAESTNTGAGRAYERFLSKDPFRFNINDLTVLQEELAGLSTSWTEGVDNALVGIIGFNPETFNTALTTDIMGLTQQFADLDFGTWAFSSDEIDFSFDPAFYDIIVIVKDIIENNDEFSAYFIDVLDQMYVDFEALSGDWIVYNQETEAWNLNFDALTTQASIEQFLNEVADQLADSGTTVSEIQGWLVIDPLQELFDQTYEQLDNEQLATLNNILGKIGLPDLGQMVSFTRSPRPSVDFVKEGKLSMQGVMDVTQHYKEIDAEMKNGKSVEEAIASATGKDYYKEVKPDNDPNRFHCGPRLSLTGFSGSDEDLNGLWTLAMNSGGTPETNDNYPYYKQRGSENYMWWMWHGAVGHWVVNQTPGSHGNDRMKSAFGDFDCPQNKPDWEGNASGNEFNIAPNLCCKTLQGDVTGIATIQQFTQTNDVNEEYPIYKSTVDGEDIFLWWMWHGPVGHWVVNKTPGSHGGDMMKSDFGDAECPNDVSLWLEGPFKNVVVWPFSCQPEVPECPDMKWKGKKATKITYRGKQNGKRSYILRQTILNNSNFHPNIRGGPYTGFFMFSRKYCGLDFFNGLNDGSIQLGMFDYEDTYEIKHQHTRIDGSKGSSVTFQYYQSHVGVKDAPWSKRDGNAFKKDQFFLTISGIPDSFDKSKEADCFNLLAGVLPNDIPDTVDWTECAAGQKDAGF